MRRVALLLVLVLVSTSFLLLQLLFVHDLGRQQEPLSKLGSWILLQHSKEDSAIWRNTKLFLQLAKEHSIAVILVDSQVLNRLVSHDNYKGRQAAVQTQGQLTSFHGCHFVCAGNSTTYAVIGEFKLKSPFISSLKSRGYTRICHQVLDSREIAVDKWSSKTVVTLCTFTRDHTAVHLAVLYERHGYLWHAGVEEKVPKDIIRDSTFGSLAGAYDKFEIADRIAVDGLEMRIPRDPAHFLQQVKQSQFTGCNIQQAQLFYNTYGQDSSDKAELFRRRARQILVMAKTALDQIGVRFWLSSGTCLGWFRQCGIIPHSKDIDLGVWIKDYKPELIAEFNKQGLMLKHKFGKIEDSFELSFRTVENDVKLDIFFFYEEREYMWNGGTQARTGRKFKYIFPKFSVCWTDFLELKIRVPCPAQSYVEANYGTSWNRPVKVWNWKESPPNVRENGKWDEKDWAQVIQHF